MRSMGIRRAALFAGAATVAASALGGCGTGQVAETSKKEPSIYGVNVENANRSVLIRGLAVTYGTVQGYQAGSNAPLEIGLYNQTADPITVRIASQPPAENVKGVLSARSVGLAGGPSSSPTSSEIPAEPSGSRPAAQKGGANQSTPASATGQGTAGPSAPAQPSLAPTPTGTGSALQPAQLTIAPLGSTTFRPGDPQSLQLIGLSGPLVPGNSVNLVFSFSNGVPPLTVQAPVGVPLSPAPRGSAENDGVGEEEG